MGCASSKPQVNQPSASVPSSVTQSNKNAHEKSVRFADEATEISDKRNYDEHVSAGHGHSLGVLQDVVQDGAPQNTVATSHVETSNVDVHKHEEVKTTPAAVAASHVANNTVHPPESAVERFTPEPVVTPVSTPQLAKAVESHDNHTHSHVEVKSETPAAAPVAAPVVSVASTHHEEPADVVTPPSPASAEPVASVATAAPTTTAPPAATAAPVAAAPVVAITSQEIKVPDMKKGYMLKQGHVVKNWKNRFFVLEEGMLTYYESSTANAPYGVNKKGEMSLRDVTVSDSKTFVTLSSRGKNGADLVLEIKYPNEREEWIAAIRQHAAWLKTSGR